MNSENILILGIFIGGGIIFTLFSFFRYFFIGYAPQDRYAIGNNNNGSNHLLLFFLFSIAAFFLIKQISSNSNPFSDNKIEERKAQQSDNLVHFFEKGNSNSKHQKDRSKTKDKVYLNKSPSKEFFSMDSQEEEEEEEEEEEVSPMYSIQLGAYKELRFAKENAIEYKKKYSKYSVFLYYDLNSNLIKILIGNLTSKEKATDLKHYFNRKLKINSFVKEFSNSNLPELHEVYAE